MSKLMMLHQNLLAQQVLEQAQQAHSYQHYQPSW